MTERVKAKKLHWLPYHKALIAQPDDGSGRYEFCEKSRRVGFDYAKAYKHSMKRAKGHARDLWYTSADESAAYEFAQYCRYFLGRVNAVAEHFTEHLEDAQDSKGAIKAFCIRFPSGVRINCLSSSPRRLRSKGGDVLISEFAFHDDPPALYAAAQPVTMWGDNLEIGSTHNGEGSKFNEFCRAAKSRSLPDGRGSDRGVPWRHIMVPIQTAVEDGLVELINAERGTAFTRDGFLAELRAGCATEDHWLQEYCCIPSTETLAWLTYELIRTCEDDNCPAVDEPMIAGHLESDRLLGVRYYAGIDVARKRDLTVLTLLANVGDVKWCRRILTLHNMRIPDQVSVLAGVIKEARVQRTCVDATGLGLGLAESLQQQFGDYAVEAVTFTGPVKEALAVPVRAAFEDRKVRIPMDAKLRESLHKVRKTVTATHQVRFEGERDEAGHADEFWSLALALEAAKDYGAVGVSVVR